MTRQDGLDTHPNQSVEEVHPQEITTYEEEIPSSTKDAAAGPTNGDFLGAGDWIVNAGGPTGDSVNTAEPNVEIDGGFFGGIFETIGRMLESIGGFLGEALKGFGED